ncbi:YlxM family DNA-binding protein [Alicyclobacillus sp.]|uniref:YlxM family DNA-binding protein n=1 Tax=Alicyclobacillus sp. TaxID=61169 RepID=UPI0025C60BAB|nr:YlxM family DNA-binding protein [Alicyclobacillus sp.]MCL6516452.1 YlxM family DNA-binding protein [Alicyclobacillus sp.]
MEKVTRMGQLYDCYGQLLTERQRQMVELHYLDDWSLAEIAAQFGVSRQAVHDNLRRAEEQLEAYESALALVRASDLMRRVADMWPRAAAGMAPADREQMAGWLRELAGILRSPWEEG